MVDYSVLAEITGCPKASGKQSNFDRDRVCFLGNSESSIKIDLKVWDIIKA